jgi:hypothetical protein
MLSSCGCGRWLAGVLREEGPAAREARWLAAMDARVARLEASGAEADDRLGRLDRAAQREQRLEAAGQRAGMRGGAVSGAKARAVAAASPLAPPAPTLPVVDWVAAAVAAAAAGGYEAPRVELLLPGPTAAPSGPGASVAEGGVEGDKKGGKAKANAAGGSVVIRHLLAPAAFARVEALREALPVDVPYEDNPVSHARSLHKRYFNDAPAGQSDAWLVALFEDALRAALGPLAAPPRRSCTVLPRFRFIEYEAGQGMAAHTDGSMQHPATLRRCTHTFLFYLRTCAQGGETDLLQSTSPGAPVLASVRPERNALLLFAGKAAHVGRGVLAGDPKIVLRGDVYFDELLPAAAAATAAEPELPAAAEPAGGP